MLLALAGYLALCAAAGAGETVVTLGPEINAGGGAGGNQYQCDLRVNPLSSGQIGITAKNSHDETKTLILTTQDGGATWGFERLDRSGDPDLVYDLSNRCHWMFIDKSSGKTLGYRRSLDGGRTWSAKTVLTPGVDHPHIACDWQTASPYKNSIYIAGRNFSGGKVTVFRSRNGGDAWESASISPGTQLGLGFVYNLQILRDGTLIVPMRTKNNILSENGVYAGNKVDIYCLRSEDGGVTFQPPVYVCPKNSPAVSGEGGFFALSAGSGPWAGGERLYIAFAKANPAPTPCSLVLTTSDDGGKTWTQPREIAPATPDGWGAGSCSVMVNKDGVVGIQYYSIRGSSFDIYFVASTDGGATFCAPVRVTTATSSEPPDQPRTFGQDQVYGDVGPDGRFHLVWTDARANPSQYTIYTRTATVTAGEVPNHAPVATPKSVSVNEDGSKSITLSGTDTDGDALTYTVTVPPQHGTLSGTTPNLTYRPAANFNGADSFTFTVSDGKTTSPAAKVSITVTAVNDAPAATPKSVSVSEDGNKAITLAGTDAAGDALTYAVTVQPQHGALSGTAPNLTYRPAANYNGADSFSFTVSDGKATSPAAKVSINVTAVNDAPAASASTASAVVPVSVGARLTATASDVDGDPLTYAWHGPAGVTFEDVSAASTHASFAAPGAYPLTVTVSDGTTSVSASVTVTAKTDAAPLAVKVSATPESGPAPLTVQFASVTTGGSAPNSKPIDFNSVSIVSFSSSLDQTPAYQILDNGATLRISGNSWKRVPLRYTITENTVLEFEFKSSSEGWTHGIGLCHSSGLTLGNLHKVYGTLDGFGNEAYDGQYASAPEWQSYTIPVGGPTWEVYWLAFAAYDGADQDCESSFRNVRLYERNPIVSYTYAWDFGDGTSGDGPNPTHVYSDTGIYTAMVTVTDDTGATASDSIIIVVGDATPPTVAATTVVLKGTASDLDSGVISVTVNGSPATLNSDGCWRKEVSLSPGKNEFAIQARDNAANVASTTVTITR